MGFLDKMRGRDGRVSADLVSDPVCGMKIAPSKAAGTSTHGRDTYHFCSAGCKAKFDSDPHGFLGAHHH